MTSTRKQIDALRKAAAAQGWTEVEKKNGWQLRSPDGVTTATLHKTPSDSRWYQNTLRDLRRGGFKQ